MELGGHGQKVKWHSWKEEYARLAPLFKIGRAERHTSAARDPASRNRPQAPMAEFLPVRHAGAF
jgi:hypothetical protein